MILGGFLLTVGSGLIAVGGLVWSLKRVIADQQKSEAVIVALDKRLTDHFADKDAHVNHLHMSALKENIVELKNSQKETNAKLENYQKEINGKLDRIVEKLYERK